jgi:fructose-1,6-bisphosphatase/inositol monophosphatase family enzyme
MSESLTREVHAIMRRAAERAIRPRYRTLAEHEVEAKASDDVVTVADHEAEAILAEGLAKLLPEATVVGMAERGETVAGWILDVLTGRFCHALRGGGAFVDGERIHARPSGAKPPIAAISLVFADPARREALKRQITPHYTCVDIPRCAAEQWPRLALGINDVSIFERTLAWDHAAGVLLLNEAGGKAARPDGRHFRVDEHLQPGLIGASSPALWDELAERMSKLA